MKLSTYKTISDAMVLLLQPLLEIVIHDVDSGTIAYINGGLSNRKVGDSSLFDKEEFEEDLNQIVYPHLNFDGRLMKSISVRISDQWLYCINCDVSIFNQMQILSQKFMRQTLNDQPGSLFKNDWQDKLHIAIHRFINEKSWLFANLTNAEKKMIINHLFIIGAFSEKNAADYVANVLAVGRATIFKYLKEWREEQ